MVFSNATINTTRAGTPVLTNHRCQVEFLSLRERTMAIGAVYDARIFDEASTNWHQGDVVTLVSFDNNALPQVTKYKVDLVLEEPGPLQVVEVQLVGVYQ